MVVLETLVVWSILPPHKSGHPPTVEVHEDLENHWSVTVSLICSLESTSVIIGLQFIDGECIVSSWKFEEPFRLVKSAIKDLFALIQQISAHVSNNGKQINIINGQGSCSVAHPMPCCMESKDNLGNPPEWLMCMFLRRVILSAYEKSIS